MLRDTSFSLALEAFMKNDCGWVALFIALGCGVGEYG